MIKGEEYIVKIKKLINNGLGLAKVDGKTVFVQASCPDDVLKIKIIKSNKNYSEAEIVEVIEPSKFRVKPQCALHNVCGSCMWQFIDYNEQLKQKTNIVKETLNSIADMDFPVLTAIPSPKTSEYRCKIQMPVGQTKVSKRILSGYYKKNSHELINIKYCPMQPDIVNKISEFIKEKAADFNITGYDEKTNKGLLRHIIYRLSSDYSQILLIFVLNSNNIDKSLKKFSEVIFREFPNITGVCANYNNKKTNVILGNKTEIIQGNSYYIEQLHNKKFKVSATSFFQVNPKCAEIIFDKVKDLIITRIDKPVILDAYSGVSSFGIWLSDIAKKVYSIEEINSASQDAIYNKSLNNADNLEVINGNADIEIEKLINKGINFDVIVTDPPRKGCNKIALDNILKPKAKYIIYVSCNPCNTCQRFKNNIKKRI